MRWRSASPGRQCSPPAIRHDPAACELSAAAARTATVGLCGDPVSGLCRALHHHAQHAARAPLRRPAVRDRHGGDLAAGFWSLMTGTVVVMAIAAIQIQRSVPVIRVRCGASAAARKPRTIVARSRSFEKGRAHGDLRTRRPETRAAGRRPLLDRRDRDRDRPRAADDRRQHLVRLGAARRQRMDRARRALADPGQRDAAHRSRASRSSSGAIA